VLYLGEANLVRGENELALKSYQKSLELNPNNSKNKEAIKKISNNT